MMKNVDNSIFRGLQMHVDGKTPMVLPSPWGWPKVAWAWPATKYYDESTPDEVKALVDAAEQR